MTDRGKAVMIILGFCFSIFLIAAGYAVKALTTDVTHHPSPVVPAGVCVLTSTDFNAQTVATITPGHLRNGVIVCDAGNWVSTTPIVSK
jgi:hypothetical protein